MNKFICFSLLVLAIGCSEQPKTDTEIASKKINETESIEFKKYSSIIEMLKETGDFSEEEGTLKFLSQQGTDPIHIQISKPVVEGDQESVVVDQTKRDIIYVAFQTFAQTDISEITITSIPMKGKENYINKYKMTVTISRQKASNILNKYLNTYSFQDLYQLDGTLWLPNRNFDNLKFASLNSVYSDVSNKQ